MGSLAIGPDVSLSKAQSSKGDGKWPAPHLEREAANKPSQDKDLQGVPPSGSTKGSFPETQLKPPVHRQDWRGPDVAPCVSGGSCELCSSPSETKTALFPSCPVCGGIQETSILSSQMFAPNLEPSLSEQLHGEMATYVNIPTSPTAKKQLHYMEVELQEPSGSVRGGDATKYAQIDITATETAHKVGTQHAYFREERLQELEQQQKKDGGLPSSS